MEASDFRPIQTIVGNMKFEHRNIMLNHERIRPKDFPRAMKTAWKSSWIKIRDFDAKAVSSRIQSMAQARRRHNATLHATLKKGTKFQGPQMCHFQRMTNKGHHLPCFNQAVDSKRFCNQHLLYKNRLKAQRGVTRRLFFWNGKTYVFVEANRVRGPQIIELPDNLNEADIQMKREWDRDLESYKKGLEFLLEKGGNSLRINRTAELEVEFEQFITGFPSIKSGCASMIDTWYMVNRYVQDFMERPIDDTKWEIWEDWAYFFNNFAQKQKDQGFSRQSPNWPKQLLISQENTPSAWNYNNSREETGVLGGDVYFMSNTNTKPILGLASQSPIPFMAELPEADMKSGYSVVLIYEGWRAAKRLCETDAAHGDMPTASLINLDSGYSCQTTEIAAISKSTINFNNCFK